MRAADQVGGGEDPAGDVDAVRPGGDEVAVSRSTSSTTSATITSARATVSVSTSRCSGSVDPTDTTVIPGASQRPNRTGDSSRLRAAQMTSAAPSTASRGDAVGFTGNGRSAAAAANRSLLAARGL